MCHKLTKEPVVDHVKPVVPTNWGKETFWDWDVYISMMFGNTLQVLDKKCHQKKSNLERQERKSGT
jgi:hypothetical protein